MAIDKRSSPSQKKVCPGCNGSGQTAYFGGESRFMFTWEDCPDCCGTGVELSASELEPTPTTKKDQKK